MIVPLNLIQNKTTFQVVKIQGGRGILQKTIQLGLIPDSEWELVSNLGLGPIVIQKDEYRIGIGHEMAKKIFIKLKGDKNE